MYKVGVFFGKMIPPSRGHISAIINASTKCEKLYVVVSDNKNMTKEICKKSNLPTITAELRIQWLSQELQDLPHIKIAHLDETDIPVYPNGWREWSNLMKNIIPENIDAFFVGEVEYKEKLKLYFPNSTCEVFDSDRARYPISSTLIRENPLKYWDYILGSARPFFAKKILITGSESCGKTTLTKYLAKLYHTSWSEEVGRYYASKYLGGNETIFTDEDFTRIAHLQFEQDYHALRTANKLVFFDTDAVVTQYYSKLYMNHENEIVDKYINPDKYDLVVLMKPDVKWIDDGQRLNSEQSQREKLHQQLKQMYTSYGFKDKIVEVGGNYSERLNEVINIINSFIKEEI